MKKTQVFSLLFLMIPALLAYGEEVRENLPEKITGKDGALMALIPGGYFFMGSDDKDIKDFTPYHNVYVESFYMDVYEVTNGRFAEFLNYAKPSEGKDGKRWEWVVIRTDLSVEERETWWPTEIIYEKNGYKAFKGFEDYPVITVSWDAAEAYCKWAGKRLPTEAEWERAARGGLEKKRFPWGNEIPTSGIVYSKQWRHNLDPPPTKKVGNYLPNDYGLYDMAGNVWEWCYDWFAPDYYQKSPGKNPKGPESGFEKVLRGGSWFNSSSDLRVATRNFSPPFLTEDGIGFRCAKDVERKKK